MECILTGQVKESVYKTAIPQQSRAGEIAKIYFVMPAQDVTIIE